MSLALLPALLRTASWNSSKNWPQLSDTNDLSTLVQNRAGFHVISFFFIKKTKRCSTSKTLDWSCNPWTCFAWKWVPLPWLPWAFELQWKIDRIMSYLVHCALIEYSVHWLIWFTICPILIAAWWGADERHLLRELQHLILGRGRVFFVTRQFDPGNARFTYRQINSIALTEIEQETPTNKQVDAGEKCSFAVKHLEPLIREEKGGFKRGLIRERTRENQRENQKGAD